MTMTEQTREVRLPKDDECQCVTCGGTFADEAAFRAHLQHGRCPYVLAGRAG